MKEIDLNKEKIIIKALKMVKGTKYHKPMNQREVARRLGIHYNTVWRWCQLYNVEKSV